MLEMLEGELLTVKAKLTGPKGYTPHKTVDGRLGNTQMFDELKFKIGARCALTWNISTADGLVNGSYGSIIGIEWTSKLSKERRIHAIIVKFDDDKAGKRHQQRNERLSRKYENRNGTPILCQEVEYNIPARKGVHAATAKIEQFPIRINYASTAHRMQVCYFISKLYCKMYSKAFTSRVRLSKLAARL